MSNHRKQMNRGFTLLEIIIVVAIIGVLAAIAIPAFQKARRQSRISAYLNDLRIAVDAFELYATDTGDYPSDAIPGVVPNGMTEYLSNMGWTNPTPLGGKWDWDRNTIGISAGVSSVGADLSHADFVIVDKKLDDGNPSTGRFKLIKPGNFVIAAKKLDDGNPSTGKSQLINGDRYTYIVEE